MLDAFGGYEAHQLLEERTKHKGFTYVWDQSSFNPVNHDLKCFIHFEFSDKSSIKRAFVYDWRLWTLPEIKDCLHEAGFKRLIFICKVGMKKMTRSQINSIKLLNVTPTQLG